MLPARVSRVVHLLPYGPMGYSVLPDAVAVVGMAWIVR